MNARQQEPPSSHLHGAGHNTSISRQRRTTKKQGGVFVAVFFSGNIRWPDREQIREPEQMQVSDSDTQEIRAGASAAVHSRADKRNQRQRTGSGAHGGSESQYRRTGEQRQQRRRRRRQEAREGDKDTQEEQSGQTRQGAEAGQRET